jgi:hypothetical protein
VSWWLLGSGIVCGCLVAAVLIALDEYLRNLRP